MRSERDRAMEEWFRAGRAPLAYFRDVLIILALVTWLLEQMA